MTAVDLPMEARPLTRHIGAELSGFDLRARFDASAYEVLRDALLRYHVIFVPEQFLGPAELLEVGARFGEILRNPLSPKVDGHPDVTELVTRDGGAPDIWHFDTSYAEVPPMASLLSMIRSPAIGGDTLWISLYAVYESLSPAMRQFVDRLTVVYESGARGPEGHVAEHPLVRIHPETGRKCLFFDPRYSTRVAELNRGEGEALLAFLRSYVADPTFACRYRWSDGTFAMWDNRCTLHRVASDFVGERIINRVTVAGDRPVAPTGAADG
jgi:taurine dioxygenase